MCGCSAHQNQNSAGAGNRDGALTFEIKEMTCGHCAGTVKQAIESRLPGVEVEADPQTRIVAVTGATDIAALRLIVAEAGYTAVL